jgi:hypothetical protein
MLLPFNMEGAFVYCRHTSLVSIAKCTSVNCLK